MDTLHNHGIAVFMDFVGAHFANDERLRSACFGEGVRAKGLPTRWGGVKSFGHVLRLWLNFGLKADRDNS